MDAARPVSVNLLDQPEFESSAIGRLLSWAITYGRYIMIGTEIIVLVAFISRFSLDRKLTDLREEISQKQIILQANLPFEQDFRAVQDTLQKTRAVISGQDKPTTIFYQIAELLPQDVTITSYELNGTAIDMNFIASTTNGLSVLLTRIQSVSGLTNIEMTEIKKDPLRGIQFRLLAKMK